MTTPTEALAKVIDLFSTESITYPMPCKASVRYSGNRRPIWEWLFQTWKGGVAVYKMYFGLAVYIWILGHKPKSELIYRIIFKNLVSAARQKGMRVSTIKTPRAAILSTIKQVKP